MSTASPQPSAGPARRTVVAAAGAAGLAAALTACGSSDDNSAGSTGSSGTSDTASAAAGSTGTTGTTGTTSQGGGTALAKTTDIPEGGGKIFKEHGVVVTQPTAGTFKAFSAKCTHQGCAVGSVSGGVIVCPCHNSHFSVADGSVKQGPATRPLPAEKITVSGENITLA